MIFQHTWQKVLDGSKTQTRRIVKPFDWVGLRSNGEAVYTIQDRIRWEVGKTYAVQPSRTGKSIARIRITNIRREDVRYISEADVKTEGFEFRLAFLKTWTQMHDKPAYRVCVEDDLSDGDESGSVSHWSAWVSWLHSRPATRYLAWALSFELVTEGGE